MELVSQNPQDTKAIAARLAKEWLREMPGRSRAFVVALQGELGAGKTTFVQGIAEALSVKEQPKSPTFTLMRSYDIPKTDYRLWHLDCYRLAGHEDLVSLDMKAIWEDPQALILVEWPERIHDALPADHIALHFRHEGHDKRRISIDTQPSRT